VRDISGQRRNPRAPYQHVASQTRHQKAKKKPNSPHPPLNLKMSRRQPERKPKAVRPLPAISASHKPHRRPATTPADNKYCKKEVLGSWLLASRIILIPDFSGEWSPSSFWGWASGWWDRGRVGRIAKHFWTTLGERTETILMTALSVVASAGRESAIRWKCERCVEQVMCRDVEREILSAIR
jgi:hypothetical protein